jgi:nucleoside-diphosphate-sugar epimerase
MPKTLNKFSEDFQYEHSSLEHENIYALSKRMAENLCSEYFNKYGLKVSIARCFAFSGECLPKDVHFAIGNFAKNVTESNTIKIRGSGKSIRSYLDQNDLVEWLLTILAKDTFDLTIYNIGSDRAISIKDLAELFSKVSDKNIKVQIMNSNDLKNTDSVYVPDCSKIKFTLGVSEKINLEDSISKMIQT